MHAIRPERTGGPEVLTLRELPTPEPGKGEVRVRVRAAGVNFVDIYQRTGLYPLPSPLPLGSEGAGVVEAVGPGASLFKPGDRVAWAQAAGSYATHVCIPESSLVPLPDPVSFELGAAVMLQGMTAHYLVKSTFKLERGQTALVHAAAGGVGLLLCQMARSIGAHVIGTVSTEEKGKKALEAGAKHVIRYTEEDFKARTLELTHGRGVQVVYDSVGKDTFQKSLEVLAPRGMLVLFGQSSGTVPPFELRGLSGGSWYLTRPSLKHYIADREELLWRARELFQAIAEDNLQVHIDRTYKLADARQAHEDLAGRKTSGKLLLLPD